MRPLAALLLSLLLAVGAPADDKGIRFRPAVAGDVQAPTDLTDCAADSMARFGDATGKLLECSKALMDDAGALTIGDPAAGDQDALLIQGTGGKNIGFHYEPSSDQLKLVIDGAEDNGLIIGEAQIKWILFRTDSYQFTTGDGVIGSLGVPADLVHSDELRLNDAQTPAGAIANAGSIVIDSTDGRLKYRQSSGDGGVLRTLDEVDSRFLLTRVTTDFVCGNSCDAEWNAEAYDTDGWSEASVSPTSVATVPAGRSLARFHCGASIDNATTQVVMHLRKNGSSAFDGNPAMDHAVTAGACLISVTSPWLEVSPGDEFECSLTTNNVLGEINLGFGSFFGGEAR